MEGETTYNMPELGDYLTLDGSGSYDPEGEPLYYSWREYPGNPETGLLPPYPQSNPEPQVYIEWPGQYTFMLTVHDGVYNSEQATVTINAPGVSGKVCVSRTNSVVPVDVAQVTAHGCIANTRSDGRFNLVGTGSGTYDLTVSKTGYTPWVETINVPTYGKHIDDIELAPNNWLFEGKVVDYADNPIPNVTVWVVPGSNIADTTDTNGDFRVQQAPEGTWHVTFSKFGYGNTTIPLHFSEYMYREQLLEQASVTTITGHVYASETSLPLSGVSITIDNKYIATSDSQGYYQIPGVAWGQYMLVSTHPQFSTYRNTISVPPAGLEWDIDMIGGLYGVYGEITDTNGDPIEGAGVDFQGGAGGKRLVSEESDRTGYYSKDVPYGNRTLVVSAPGYPTETVSRNFTGHTLLNIVLDGEPEGGDSTHTDFDGDGASDITIFREGSGLWAVRGLTRVYFGSSTDQPLPSDYDGDGCADIGIFRSGSGLWAIRGVTRVYFGSSSDTPVPGDYDGDGNCDAAVFRGSSGLWAIRGLTRVYFGSSSDAPEPEDYDGDGVTDIGIFRESSGLWAIRGISRVYFGGSDDTTVPGDYDGDGTGDIGIFRSSSGLWAIRGVTRSYFGSSSDDPVPADYDGISGINIGIFRGNSGLWAVKGVTRAYFGGSGDLPMTR